MVRLRISIRTQFGEVFAEGDTAAEVKAGLSELGISEERVAALLAMSSGRANSVVNEAGIEEIPAKPKGKIPATLVEVLGELTNRELVTTLLYYEGPILTKKELEARAIDLGKPFDSGWLDKHFAEDTRGFLAPAKTEDGKNAYKLSDQGRIKIEARVRELAKQT